MNALNRLLLIFQSLLMSLRGAAQVLAKQVMGPELLLCASRSSLQTGTVLPRLVPLLIGCLPLYLLESWMLQSVAGRLKHGDGHPSEVQAPAVLIILCAF